jgi:hypothetical protein
MSATPLHRFDARARRKALRSERVRLARYQLGDTLFQGAVIAVTALAVWGACNTSGHPWPYLSVFLALCSLVLVVTIVRWAWHGRGEK